MIRWRTILARAPLPMLALAASYGVYSFAALFVPPVIAGIQAAAFELTYIGLAVTQGLGVDQRKRATAISVGAVVTSIVYNTLAGWFHRQPALLEGASPVAWLMFAILHGAPLAWVAYLVADLQLHSDVLALSPERTTPLAETITTAQPLAIESSAPVLTLSKTARVKALAQSTGQSESTVWRGVKNGTINLDSEEE